MVQTNIIPKLLPKLLIVDDDPGNINVLTKTLANDFRLSVATNGKESIELASHVHKPDLILLDIKMPEMDGYEVCAHLKQNQATKDIPIIFLTGISEDDGGKKGFDLGAVDYITKPFNMELVTARIVSHLQCQNEKAQLKKQLNQSSDHLRQAQKMETIGNLTTGIVHDFNNVLAAMFGQAEHAMMLADKGKDVKSSLTRLIESGKLASEMIDHILLFSLNKKTKKEPLEMKTIVSKAVSFIRRTIVKSIQITENYGQSASWVDADITELHQVIMNLCINAVHAMEPGGGQLILELESVSINNENPFTRHKIPHGPYCKLRIEDSGSGIPSDILNKIFDPYFTTKEPGKGTGFGLFVVREIIKRLQGSIMVWSKPGHGTCFEILIPEIKLRNGNIQLGWI